MISSADLSEVTLAILAGGEGRRMGLPKARLRIGSKPILEYLLDRFAWPGPTLLVTAPRRERPPGAQRFDREAADAVENQGPLRGLLTALEHLRSDLCVVTTVDMPCIHIEQLSSAVQMLRLRKDAVGLMFQRAVDGRMQIEPFPFACRSAAATVISDRLKQGRRSVHALAELPGFITAPAPAHWPPSVWTNLNQPEDLQKFLDSSAI